MNFLKKLKKVIQSNKIPNMKQYNDISEFLINKNDEYESDYENMEENHVNINQETNSSKNSFTLQYSIKLHVFYLIFYLFFIIIIYLIKEIGPKLKLRLFKIEEGLMKGKVIFHRLSEFFI